jgi:hypothetical protein
VASRRSDDDGCLGCLGFPLFAWALISHLYVVPAVSDATGIKAGPALFLVVFLVTAMLVFGGMLLLLALTKSLVSWLVDAFRNN